MANIATITCDYCGEKVDFFPHTRREGALEITSLKCDACGAEFISSVTDSTLRSEIQRYQNMARMIATRTMPITFIDLAQRLHAHNVERSNTLRDQYIAAHDNGQ